MRDGGYDPRSGLTEDGPGELSGSHTITTSGDFMKLSRGIGAAIAGMAIALFAISPTLAQTPGKQPNIIMIMGDDIGWANIGA